MDIKIEQLRTSSTTQAANIHKQCANVETSQTNQISIDMFISSGCAITALAHYCYVARLVYVIQHARGPRGIPQSFPTIP